MEMNGFPSFGRFVLDPGFSTFFNGWFFYL